MSTTFILGSGISIDAGMPTVDEITGQVLSGDGARRYTDETYALSGPPWQLTEPLHRAPVDCVLMLIGMAVRLISGLAPSSEPSYEDIAYAVQQCHDAYTGEYENPIVLPFLDALAEAIGTDRTTAGERCGDAVDYIVDTVTALLHQGDLHRHDHLRALITAGEEPVCFVTLNHDLLLETALADHAIEYADGFDAIPGDVRLWADAWDHAQVQVLKLHGSVDWYDIRPLRGPGGIWQAAQMSVADVNHVADFDVRSSRPTLLTGTFTKILAYQTGVFPALHARFHEVLKGSYRLIAIGYGFGDKAINNHIKGWLDRDAGNRLVVCHRSPQAVRACARPLIQRNWGAWEAAGRLTTIPKFVGELTHDDLLRAC
jgi:hypothetical protein